MVRNDTDQLKKEELILTKCRIEDIMVVDIIRSLHGLNQFWQATSTYKIGWLPDLDSNQEPSG